LAITNNPMAQSAPPKIRFTSCLKAPYSRKNPPSTSLGELHKIAGYNERLLGDFVERIPIAPPSAP